MHSLYSLVSLWCYDVVVFYVVVYILPCILSGDKNSICNINFSCEIIYIIQRNQLIIFSMIIIYILWILYCFCCATITGFMINIIIFSTTVITPIFIWRYKSRIQGLFSAITCPAPIGPILMQGHFQERLFFCKCLCRLWLLCLITPDLVVSTVAVLHKLISSRHVCGTLRGYGDKAVYIPIVYVHKQNKWADSFFQSNGYLGNLCYSDESKVISCNCLWLSILANQRL